MACSIDFIEFVCDALAPLGEVCSRKTGCPYKGAKEAYILDFSDRRKVLDAIAILWDDLPFPKPQKKPQK